MRIGVMLRDIGNQTDAPGIIVLNLLEQILRLDRKNSYILFFQNPAFMDAFRSFDNTKTVRVRAPTKLLWDQFAVPLAARTHRVDLIFHPKHSVPLLTGKKTVMHLRGPEYWIHPGSYEIPDLLYQRTFLPLFSRKATHLIAESDYARVEFQRHLAIPDDKLSVIHLAVNERFRAMDDAEAREALIGKYSLPDRFVFTVTRVVQGRKFYPGKNIHNTIKAFLDSTASQSMKFVIVGRETRRFVAHWSSQLGWPRDLLVPLDAVDQKDLPALYSLAELFLFPSQNESFGIPILEAMACGCPVITSNCSACPEVAGDAARLVDPGNVAQITSAIDRLAEDPDLCASMARSGLRHARRFSWAKAAKETIQVFERLSHAELSEGAAS